MIWNTVKIILTAQGAAWEQIKSYQTIPCLKINRTYRMKRHQHKHKEACQLYLERPMNSQITQITMQTPKLQQKNKVQNNSHREMPNIKIRLMWKSYLLHGSALRVEFLELEGGERRACSLMPQQQQHWGDYLRQEAAHTERWPQRRHLKRQPHCSLSSPGLSMCWTLLTAPKEKSVTFNFTP